ncbi:MAG: hypothetical protein BWY42_00941 [Candidatus Omnitrophica bacterium ADurb.Bin277]|nr:MAG: hypothetical protein BWY42_00941 [Candidatus Omnitrophica bacterium ADurb.Bin277]
MTQDKLRRKCEDEARVIIELVNKTVKGNGFWDVGLENKITEALLQKEMEIERITQNAVELLSCCDKHTGLSFDDFVRAGGGKCLICLQEKLAELEKRAFEYHFEWESACLRERGRIDDVKNLEEKLRVAREALKAIFKDPYGCPMCHSGKIIRKGAEHADYCGFFLAKKALQQIGEV